MPFFSRIPVDKKQIEAAISRLESLSSAELRVYIERKVPKASAQLSAMERALEVFDELEMHKTAAQNAVLIYVGYKNHLCAIVGDKGIHQFVDVAYWQLQCDLMIEQLQGRCQPERRYPDYTGSSNNKRISSLDDCGSFYEGSFFSLCFN